MQKLITKYSRTAHLALLAVAPLFLPPVAVLWLSALGAVWVLMEPSRRPGEMLHDARRRVAWSIFLDPLFWTLFVVTALTIVRLVNSGVSMAYDSEATLWTLSSPQWQVLPGCVAGYGFPEIAGTVALLVILQGCRHALGKSARIVFFFVASLLSGIGATALTLLVFSGGVLTSPLVTCALTQPSFIGPVFGLHMIGGTVALVGAFDRRWNRIIPLSLVGIGGNACALFLFAPSAVSALYAAAELIIFIYSFVYCRLHLPGTGEFKFMVVFGLSLAAGVVAPLALMPEALFKMRTDLWMTGVIFPENYEALRSVLSGIALKVWTDNPWLGTGLGSFPLNVKFLATEADWQVLLPEHSAALNGYWQLLSERGIVGAVMLACPLAMLFWTYGRRLVGGFAAREMPRPECFVGPFVVAAILVEAAYDTSYLSPVVLLTAGVFMALSASSFPKERSNG